MRKFFAYILLCFNIIFGIGISAGYVIKNVKLDHDYDYSRQIIIKSESKKKQEILKNIKYINSQLKKRNLNYKITFDDNGIINISLIENNSNFIKINDFLTERKFKLCYKKDCVDINTNGKWLTEIEQNENEKKLIISIPESENQKIHDIYFKNIEDTNKKIEEILNSIKNNEIDKKENNKENNFFIKIEFKNGKNKKINLNFEVFYPKDNRNKFQIIFPKNNDFNKQIYKNFSQEEDIDYYETLWNTSNEQKQYNFEIINDQNFNEPLSNNLSKKFFGFNKLSFSLIATFIIIFTILAFLYRFNSIGIITILILQLFLTLFFFNITKQLFNIKTFVGLIITALTTLLISSIYSNHFNINMENGMNLKSADLEAFNKTKPIINGASVIYTLTSLFFYFFNANNNSNFGIISIFFVSIIINLIINKLVLRKLMWLINNSFITQKYYQIFSQNIFSQNNHKEEKYFFKKKIKDNTPFELTKERNLFIIFSVLFFIILSIFIFSFKKNTFKYKTFTNNIKISTIIDSNNEDNKITKPYLIKFLNEIKINNKNINFSHNIKHFSYIENNIKHEDYIINIFDDLNKKEEENLKNIIKNSLSNKINCLANLEKEYFYNPNYHQSFNIKLLLFPIIVISLFYIYLLILKYNLSQVISAFFISIITSLVPIIFISFSHFYIIEPSFTLISMLISVFFSLITCLCLICENKNNLILISNISNEESININEINVKRLILSETLKKNWQFIGKNLLITNCLFLALSFLKELTVILLALLFSLVILIFMIKYFFILISDKIDIFIEMKNKNKKNIKFLKKDYSLNGEEEIFKGINDYGN